MLRLRAVALVSLGSLCAAGVLLSYLVFPRAATTVLTIFAPGVTYFLETAVPAAALTIDDGPDPQETPAILDVLRDHDAHATFLLIGSRIPGNEPLLARMRSEGHELANHSYDDRMSLCVPSAELARSLAMTHAALSPFGAIRWFRPGSGLFSRPMLKLAREQGYRLALGDVFSLDSRFQRWYILQHAQPGSIIILHDALGRGVRTAAALGAVLPILENRGFKIVTLTALVSLAAEEAL